MPGGLRWAADCCGSSAWLAIAGQSKAGLLMGNLTLQNLDADAGWLRAKLQCGGQLSFGWAGAYSCGGASAVALRVCRGGQRGRLVGMAAAGGANAALKGAAQPRCLLGSQLPELLVERRCAQCFASGRSEILRLRVVQYCAMAA